MSISNMESAAFDRAQLRKAFSRVPLGLKLLKGPFNTGSSSIFQMNIQQSRRFGEYIQIWPGDRKNEIEVLSMDRKAAQLVLRVKEPRRPYLELIRRSSFSDIT